MFLDAFEVFSLMQEVVNIKQESLDTQKDLEDKQDLKADIEHHQEEKYPEPYRWIP